MTSESGACLIVLLVIYRCLQICDVLEIFMFTGGRSGTNVAFLDYITTLCIVLQVHKDLSVCMCVLSSFLLSSYFLSGFLLCLCITLV